MVTAYNNGMILCVWVTNDSPFGWARLWGIYKTHLNTQSRVKPTQAMRFVLTNQNKYMITARFMTKGATVSGSIMWCWSSISLPTHTQPSVLRSHWNEAISLCVGQLWTHTLTTGSRVPYLSGVVFELGLSLHHPSDSLFKLRAGQRALPQRGHDLSTLLHRGHSAETKHDLVHGHVRNVLVFQINPFH